MANYILHCFFKQTRKLNEIGPFSDYAEVLHAAILAKDSGAYSVITILREEETTAENAGKFFLHRIIQ